MTSPRLIRAARALLGWSAQELANRSGVHISTVLRIEQSGGKLRGNVRTVEKVLNTLVAAGVEFSNGEGGESVTFRSAKSRKHPSDDTVK